MAFTPLPWPEFTAHALALYAPPLRAPATRGRMRQVLRDLARLACVESTADLNAVAIARWIEGRSGEVARNTVVGELGYLSAACSIAIEAGVLDRHPFASRRLRLREEAPAVKRHHPLADLARVLESLRRRADAGWPWDRTLVAASVVAYTGLRRDEALKLRVEDVDRSAGVLEVVARSRSPLKTAASAAPVPIPPELDRVLDWWLPRCGSAWLVPNRSRSNPWTGGNHGYRPLDYLKLAGREAGVEGLTWQSLRHSWATHAEVWGLGEAEIQRVLRHSRPLTQRRYRHADLANLRAIAARVKIA